nr:hypothetical protein [Tanacetum cinerariifolium]
HAQATENLHVESASRCQLPGDRRAVGRVGQHRAKGTQADHGDLRRPDALNERAMDQALNWLIELDDADAQQQARFQDWLAADPAHREAFVRAEAVWNSQPVLDAAVQLAAPKKPSMLRRLRPHWVPLATAAALLLGLFNFSDLPLRLKADHLTVAGERQRLELSDGSKVLLNTRSAFSSELDDRQRVARLYQGEAFFEVPTAKGMPLEVEAGPFPGQPWRRRQPAGRARRRWPSGKSRPEQGSSLDSRTIDLR